MNSKFLMYVFKRLLLAVMTIFLVVAITFFVMHAIPASPFSSEKAKSDATIAALEAKYGFDKPVPVVTKTDSIGRPFEINGYMFYLRNDALYDESGNIVADLSIENNRTNKNAQASPTLKDVLTEGLGYENKGFEDFSIFGCSKEEV